MTNPEKASWFALLIAVTAVALVACLVLVHAPGLNGPWYWKWPWRRLDAIRVFPALLAGLVPLGVALWRFQRGREGLFAPLFLVALSCFCVQIIAAGVQSEPFALERIWRVITHEGATSYFGDALRLRSRPDLLRDFPELMPNLVLHSRTHPPGPILFHTAMIELFGPKLAAALAGGLLIGLLGSLSPPATFWMARGFGADRTTAFHAAVCVSLCPGLLLFFPELDQVYPVLTCSILGAWVFALRTQRPGYAALAGLAFGVASFFTYSVLVLGAFLASYTLVRISNAPSLTAPGGPARQLALATGVVAALYAALYLLWGFDPFATFRSALTNQAQLAAMLGRPYAPSLLFDPLDFALGMGWLPVVLAAAHLASALRGERDHDFWVVCFCLGQVAIVALSGLLRCEAARVWIFLFPLVAYPAARQLARWSLAQQLLAYLALALFTGVVLQNMIFLDV